MAAPPVPWAEGRSRYTVEFETEVVAWPQEASILAVEAHEDKLERRQRDHGTGRGATGT